MKPHWLAGKVTSGVGKPTAIPFDLNLYDFPGSDVSPSQVNVVRAVEFQGFDVSQADGTYAPMVENDGAGAPS